MAWERVIFVFIRKVSGYLWSWGLSRVGVIMWGCRFDNLREPFFCGEDEPEGLGCKEVLDRRPSGSSVRVARRSPVVLGSSGGTRTCNQPVNSRVVWLLYRGRYG